jgi:uncharacterized membrane protein
MPDQQQQQPKNVLTDLADLVSGASDVLKGESRPTIEVSIEKESLWTLGLVLLLAFVIAIIIWAIARNVSNP